MSKLEQELFKGDLKITFGYIDFNDGTGDQRYMRIVKRRPTTDGKVHSAGLAERDAWRVVDEAWCKKTLPKMAAHIYGLAYTRHDVTRIHDAILEGLEELIRLESLEEDSHNDQMEFLERLGMTVEMKSAVAN